MVRIPESGVWGFQGLEFGVEVFFFLSGGGVEGLGFRVSGLGCV